MASSLILGLAFLAYPRPNFSLHSLYVSSASSLPLFFGCFFLWAIASLLWSHHYASSTYTLFKITPFLCFGMFLSWKTDKHAQSLTHDPHPFFSWLHYGFSLGYSIACGLLLLLPWIEAAGYFHLSTKTKIQGGLFLSLSFWVVLKTVWEIPFFYRWMKGVSIAALSTMTLYALKVSKCDTTIVSLALSMVVAILFYSIRSTPFRNPIKALIILSVLTTPLICFYGFSKTYAPSFQTLFHDPSYLHRLHLWHKTSHVIARSPIIGYGIGTSSMFSTPDTFDLEYHDTNGIKYTVKAEKMGLHPHNIALQLWLELGVVGALLGGWIIAFIFQNVSKATSRTAFISHMGCFITAMTIFWINVGTFQTWWLSSIVCVILLFFSSNDTAVYAKKSLISSKENG